MKPNYISDNDWQLVNSICNLNTEEPYLIAGIGWHETHWGTIGAGVNGYHLGFGFYPGSPILAKVKGLSNQLKYAHEFIMASFKFPVTLENTTEFAVNHWKSSVPTAWAKDVYNIFLSVTKEQTMDKNTQLTANFLYGEFWSNNFGKPKVEPPKEYYPNILHVAQQLQMVRNRLNMDRKAGTPEISISVNSGYRTKEWNASKDVEGVPNSLHLTGSAADTHANGVPLMIYYSYILRYTDLNELGFYKVMDFVHAGIMNKLNIFKY